MCENLTGEGTWMRGVFMSALDESLFMTKMRST